MTKVCPGLWVGNDKDVQLARERGYAILHAAKEPWHREFVGYETKGCPPDDPEYLFARRDKELALNLIDAPDPKLIPEEVINTGLDFIQEMLADGEKCLVHCNMGYSRSPSLCILYLAKIGLLPANVKQAIRRFRRLYPEYSPGIGMKYYLEKHIPHAVETSAKIVLS